jgi:hypothetical protein
MAASLNWIEQRAADLADASAYLRHRCVLVTIIDRESPIRWYKVGGKRDLMVDSEVIAYADWLKTREARRDGGLHRGEARDAS